MVMVKKTSVVVETPVHHPEVALCCVEMVRTITERVGTTTGSTNDDEKGTGATTTKEFFRLSSSS